MPPAAEVPAEELQAETQLQEQAVGEAGRIAVPPPPEEGQAEGGASYTPVAEEGGKPRRLKDLEAGMELEGRVVSAHGRYTRKAS